MKHLFWSLFILSALWMSCSPDEDVSFDPNLELLFSNDSVSFDTLLSGARSSTRRLMVYNPNGSAVELSGISLGKGTGSEYEVVINGKGGTGVLNERILGGDSLMILVEVTINPRNEDLPYLVKDSLVFDWNGNREHVKLVSWGQDGRKIGKQVLCDVTWTNARPYILSDTVLVQSGCQLIIEKGTQIYFENDAGLFVQGTLQAIGDSTDHIVFRNARFDGIYDQVPGQWNGIYFLEGSTNNEIAFAEIFNGTFGLRIGTPDEDTIPDVRVSSTRIYNMAVAGILAFTSDVEATNCLVYNCGTYLTGSFAGGNYTYRHCTFSNEQSFFVQDAPSVQFSDNLVIGENELLTDDLSLELTNCIVWGSGSEELLINNGGGATVTATLTTNIIRSGLEIQGNFTSQEFNFPGFIDTFGFDYSLEEGAFARDKGTNIGIVKDITHANRDAQPDIGAFEWVDEE